MDIVMIVVIALHALSGVFWAGSTAAMANLGAPNAGRIFPGQMISAAIVVVTGIVLWAVWRGAAFGTSEIILLVGIAAAIAAAGIQGAVIGRARRTGTIAEAQPRVVAAYRTTAGLLMLTVITMVTSRFF